MGKAGRIACIFTPYMLTVASLVCIILVGLGCTTKGSTLDSLYFAKLDLKDLSTDSLKIDKGLNPLTKALQQADAAGDIHDFYIIGLWNYCYGDYKNGNYEITTCTPRQNRFWFNPVTVWKLDGTGNLLPNDLEKALQSYSHAAGWLSIAYTVAFCVTAAELVIGISAIFSRWGSFFTTICSAVSSFFILAATVSATALFGVFIGTVDSALRPYNIKASFGRNMMITTWLATLFSLGAGLFWLFSVCCCSGRSPYSHDKKNKRVVVEKTPYTYERVGSPYRGSATSPARGGAPASTRNSAYEPFRHEQHV